MAGTLTRANRLLRRSGSRTVTASDSDRLEMWGNGWLGSTASGRQHREDLVLEVVAELVELLLVQLAHVGQADALLGQRRDHLVEEAAHLGLDRRADVLGDRLERVVGGEAVRAAPGDAFLDLLAQAGHPDHVELVQVGGEDRQEAEPFQQRRGRVGGQVQDPVVELQPGDLAVDVQVRVEQVPLRLFGHGVALGVGQGFPPRTAAATPPAPTGAHGCICPRT